MIRNSSKPAVSSRSRRLKRSSAKHCSDSRSIDITTYNRVEHLAKRDLKQLLLAMILLLLVGGIWGIVDLFLSASPPVLAVVWPLSSIFLALALTIFTLRRRTICRLCGNPLDTVRRPFQYKNEYLFGDNLLIDGDVFTRYSPGILPGGKRWGKLYHWSRACHHCRIYEHAYNEAITPATESEQEKIRQSQEESCVLHPV